MWPHRLLAAALLPLAALAAPKTGKIVVKANTAGAVVSIDDLEIGIAPLPPTELVAGYHQIRVSRPGYLEYLEKVTIESGKTVEVTADLLPVSGVLTVKADEAGAKVVVDAKEVGATPLYNHELQPGEHTVVVVFASGRTIERLMAVTAGKDYLVEAKAALARLSTPEIPEVAAAAPAAAAPAVAAPAPAAAVAPAVEPSPPVLAAEESPWYGQWWVWAAAGAVAVAAIAIPVATSGTEYVRLPPAPDKDCGPGGPCVVLQGAR